MSAPETTGKIFDAQVLKRILRRVQPYRRRFILTGLMVALLAGMSWVRPYLIRVAMGEHIAVGDREGLLFIFLVVVGLIMVEALLQFCHAKEYALKGNAAYSKPSIEIGTVP